MNQKSIWGLGVLLIAVSASGADVKGNSVAAGRESAVAKEQRLIVSRADHGRQEVERKGDGLVRDANLKLAAGEYMAACSLYRVAKIEFKKFNSPYFSRKIEFCDRQIARCYYLQAEDAIRDADRSYQRGDFETAIKLCKEALKYCPEQADRLEALIAQYERRKNHAAERDSVSTERLVPNKKAQEYQIEVLLEQGRKLVAAGDLGAAVRKYQEIMLIDPYNAAAVKSLEGVYIRIGKIGDARFNATHRRMLSEAEWKFATPVFPEAEGKGNTVNFLSSGSKQKDVSGSSALAQKLNSIVIKEFSFDDIPISVVVNHLRELTKQHDPAHLGVNFVYLPKNVVRLEAKAIEGATSGSTGEGGEAAPAPAPAPAPAAAPAAAAAEGEGGEGGNEANQAPQEKTVSFSLNNATAMDVLRKFKDQYGIKYKITDNYVIIAPEHVALGDMENRVFNVEITDFDSDEDLKNRLVAAGISYGPGTSLKYDRNIGCIYATNTADNLERTEKFLEEEYNRAEPMIQVMLKVVELSQKDINELAFNWQYAVNSKTALTNAAGTPNSQTVIQENSNELLRYYRPDDAKSKVNGQVPDSTLSYVWQNSDGTKLVASMFALNWADSGDVLYSPRVTVRNNQVGTVIMGTLRYFPEEWEVLDTTTPSSETGWFITGSTPQPTFSDDAETLGMRLSVQPRILDGSRVIQAKILLPIRTFVSWMTFDARQRNPDESNSSDDGEYFKMPIFNDRSIDTTVHVYDGDTVLIGGVATDLTKTYNDKIPILGDIPFIGRFFQSRYSQAEKGNMLVFLSCRIVNPDGSAKYPEGKRPNGVVNFGQNL